jgi:phosphate transport system substrate-binding protein
LRCRNKGLIILLLSLLLFSGCSRLQGGITVAGSTSVQPFAELLAEEYMNLHPEININVQGGGSSAGILATMSGAADIGMSSRELTGEETALWSVPIAIDGLALIVHPSNPIKGLSLAQAREIYAGNIKNWGGSKEIIHLVTREEGSGTRDAFQKLVMGKEDIALTAIVQDSNGAVREVVANDPAAIGFLSLGLVNERVKALEIDGIAATKENIINSSYGLFRRFLFLTREVPTGEIKQFIEFTLSAEGQNLLSNEGLISINAGAGK